MARSFALILILAVYGFAVTVLGVVLGGVPTSSQPPKGRVGNCVV
jgi:hypothetical protein